MKRRVARTVRAVSEEAADRLVDALVFCAYCGEPFKECDTVIPGVGVVVGETDVVRWRCRYWHAGCVDDRAKELTLRRG